VSLKYQMAAPEPMTATRMSKARSRPKKDFIGSPGSVQFSREAARAGFGMADKAPTFGRLPGSFRNRTDVWTKMNGMDRMECQEIEFRGLKDPIHPIYPGPFSGNGPRLLPSLGTLEWRV
jgi:hypothetical protein